MTGVALIVGLGNPGREYANTRHNIGFRCVDALANRHNLIFDDKKRAKAKVASGQIGTQRVVLAKPQTYMNLSGSAVQSLLSFYRIPPARLIVIYDDLDLPVGTLRIRPKGGSGGHRGMADIIQRLGTQDFPRIRVGIGRPDPHIDPAAYVLRPFRDEEEPLIQEAVARVISAVETWLTDGIDRAMNRYNGSAQDVLQRNAQATPAPADADPNSPSPQ